MTDLQSLLEPICPVATDEAALDEASTDKSGIVGSAWLVARPTNSEQVAAVLRAANQHAFPVVPRGAGTGRCGGAVPELGGVVLDLMGLDEIVEIDRREGIVRVQPGVRLGALQAAVEEVGLWFPPDPASARDCAVGGAIATSAGGLRGAKYGTIKHYVLGLEVVLPMGEVVRTGARTRKSVTGYDMTSLFVGSEGTLGVVTEATLRLIPMPETAGTLVAWFDHAEAAEAGVGAALDVPAIARALEYVDARALAAVEAFRDDFDPAGRAGLILVECDGSAESVRAELALYERALLAAGAVRVDRADDPATAEALWDARRGISPAVTARWPNRFSEDVCVPRARFVEMIRALHEIAAAHGLEALGFGHAGDGNIHASILMQRGDDEERARAHRAVEDVFRSALAMGGTLSAEHGIAITKRAFLPLEITPPHLAAQRAVKRALDPRNVLNPGKIFPVETDAEPDAGSAA